MAAERGKADAVYGPWNPGIQSELPSRLVPLSKIFRPANVFTSVAQAAELSDLTGLPLEDLAIFRPERLVVHELLIRVTANISVSDPEAAQIDDLGINFRRIARTMHTQYIEPHLPEIAALYASLKQALSDVIAAELAVISPPTPSASIITPIGRRGLRGWFDRLARRLRRPAQRDDPCEREERTLLAWEAEIGARTTLCAGQPVMRCPGLSPQSAASTVAGGGTGCSSVQSPPVSPATSIAAERSVAPSIP